MDYSALAPVFQFFTSNLGSIVVYEDDVVGGAVPGGSASTRYKNAGPAPLSYYAPPHTKIKKKRKITAGLAKEIYEEAIENVPLAMQAGLLPIAFRTEGRGNTILPPPDVVDFTRLSKSLETITRLVHAIEQSMAKEQAGRLVAQAARIRYEEEQEENRRRMEEEEAIILFLLRNS